MKFEFKYQFELIPAQGYDQFGGVKYITICTGGSFLPKDKKAEIYLTPYSIVLKYKDWSNESLSCFGIYKDVPKTALSYSFNKQMTPKQILQSLEFYIKNTRAYLGPWKKEMEKEKDIHLYYFIQDGFIHKMFISKTEGFQLGNLLGCDYIMEVNGSMLSCTPDEGDIIYDNLPEAKKELKKRTKK